MMDFMDNLRRGVDRAGFEVDRLLRANRVRSGIGTIRSQMDEELRQIGRQIMDLYDRKEAIPELVRERCVQIKRYEAEIAEREAELDGINAENPPDVDWGALGAATPRCPNCGQPVGPGANFCANCGASLSASVDRTSTPAAGPVSTDPAAPGEPIKPLSAPPPPTE